MAAGESSTPDEQRGLAASPELRRATDAAVEPARLRLEQLLAELLQRGGEVLETQGRLRGLLDAVVSVTEEISLPIVLERIVLAACQLVDARYGALGILAPGRDRLSEFITVGLSPEDTERIGALPEGQGVLGVLINDARTLRLPDLAAHPRSVGFPPNHPKMATFLGVPLRIRGRVFGNLYLTEKSDGREFTEEDEQLVVALAAAAGSVVQNAQLYDQEQRRQRWLLASNAITSATLRGDGEQDLLMLIATQARHVVGAGLSVIFVPLDDKSLVVVAADGASADTIVGSVVARIDSPAGEVMTTGKAVVVDGAGGVASIPPRSVDAIAIGGAIFVPLMGETDPATPSGVLAVADSTDTTGGWSAVDVESITTYAGQAAVALQLARAQRERSVIAVFEERDRIGRDLHDLVIQRLFATGMTLQSLAPLVDRPDVAARINRAVDDLDATIHEVRQTIYQLHSANSPDDARIAIHRVFEEVTAGATFQTRLHLSGPIGTIGDDRAVPHLLAALRETVSNAVRHSRASTVEVTVEVVPDAVVLRVLDDGVGLDPAANRRSGLANLADRAAELGGTFDIGPVADGCGTRAVWRVPLTAV